jgi:hypothetical protein
LACAVLYQLKQPQLDLTFEELTNENPDEHYDERSDTANMTESCRRSEKKALEEGKMRRDEIAQNYCRR